MTVIVKMQTSLSVQMLNTKIDSGWWFVHNMRSAVITGPSSLVPKASNRTQFVFFPCSHKSVNVTGRFSRLIEKAQLKLITQGRQSLIQLSCLIKQVSTLMESFQLVNAVVYLSILKDAVLCALQVPVRHFAVHCNVGSHKTIQNHLK